MKYDVVFPVVVSKTNGTGVPVPLDFKIKVEAEDQTHALYEVQVLLQRILDNERF